MHIKTMEGLVGARTDINLASTPLRVFEEASRKGDTAKMERAMGYVNEMTDSAQKYKAEADQGMKEDAKEVREKAEAERENAIQKRKEEREEFEKRLEQNRDTVAAGGDENAALKDSSDLEGAEPNDGVSMEATADTIQAEPVTYTKTGEVTPSQVEPAANISVSV